MLASGVMHMASEATTAYYRYVKALPCVSCGARANALEPNEADHLRPPSGKLPGQLANRSHKGEAGWYCLPLCKPCHLSRHLRREDDWYTEHVGNPAYVYGLIVRQIIEYHREYGAAK